MRHSELICLALLLAIACTAWGEEPTANASRKDANAAEEATDCGCCKKCYGYAMPPCHCLQDMLQDYPGPNDLYYCFTHLNNCNEGEEEMWYGMPSNSYRPQICENNECERYGGYIDRATRIPGHAMALPASGAWETVEAALEAAATKNPQLKWGDPEYHEIPREEIPEGLEVTTDIIVMAVPIVSVKRKSPPKGSIFHLWMQIDSAEDEETTPVEVVEAKPGTGRQFSVIYKVRGEERKGLVWLK